MNILQFSTYKREQSGADSKGPQLLLSLLLGFTSLSCLLSCFSMRLTLCLSKFLPEMLVLSLFSFWGEGGVGVSYNLTLAPCNTLTLSRHPTVLLAPL